MLRILHSNGKATLEYEQGRNETFEQKHKLTDKGWVTI